MSKPAQEVSLSGASLLTPYTPFSNLVELDPFAACRKLRNCLCLATAVVLQRMRLKSWPLGPPLGSLFVHCSFVLQCVIKGFDLG